MKNTFMAATLTTFMAATPLAAQNAEEPDSFANAINNVEILIFGDADECIQESIKEQFQLLAEATLRGDETLGFAMTPESLALLKSTCEADTGSEATIKTEHLMQGVTTQTHIGSPE